MTNDILYCYICIKALGACRSVDYDGTNVYVYPWLRTPSSAPGFVLGVSATDSSFMYYLVDFGVKDSYWMVPCL